MNVPRAVRRVLARVAPAARRPLDTYVLKAPDPQNALDIFSDEWASRLPPPLDGHRAGSHPLFDDARIRWLDREVGGVAGKSALELGPLEGGHAYMLERLGAEEVVAVEGNTRAYLKCLIVKEVLGLRRVRFLCGDILEYLRREERRFDLCLASGVLYHMQDPVELIDLLSRRCAGFLLLWTHYYDPVMVRSDRRLARKFGSGREHERGGFRHTLYPYHYRDAREKPGFCGGALPTSAWMTREEILSALAHFGFADLRVGSDEPRQRNGPAFAVIARRS
ncbi:MAG TPA: class I SAM-dependent methyltransferase [Candidatus Cryosericum sp.]|nr:class I SAM-dependent methyltransferase [Candidatus Cryosericum sp.]